MGQVVYRYQPAVVIVSLVWHQTTVGFGELLYDRLRLSYTNTPDYVSLPPVLYSGLRRIDEPVGDAAGAFAQW